MDGNGENVNAFRMNTDPPEEGVSERTEDVVEQAIEHADEEQDPGGETPQEPVQDEP